MQKKKGIQIETIFMWLAILLLIALGVRGRLEVKIQGQQKEILELEQYAINKIRETIYLKKQLRPMEYSQPLDQIKVSSTTGIRVNPMGGGKEKLHEGLDLKGRIGDSVYSILPGKIVENWLPLGYHNGKYYNGHPIFGGYIVIDHGDELFSKYGHLSKTFVHEDKWIEQGQIIGEMGSTGKSTGCHLHLEIVINPFRYLKERKILIGDRRSSR